MICLISLQTQIFGSPGYQKFVTQKDGSMDLLCSLSELKAKSMAYVYNNHKIRAIYSIQRKKEVILATVEKLKEKIVRWRRFTRTTLDTSVPSPVSKIDQLHEPLLSQETPTPIRLKKSVTIAAPEFEDNKSFGDSDSNHEDEIVLRKRGHHLSRSAARELQA